MQGLVRGSILLRCWSRFLAGGVAMLVLLYGTGRAVAADPTADDKALATVLFQEGRKLMAEGKVSEACLKLEESQRLDPSGGTLLNLALCHEQEGRLARSWSEFNEAVALARRDGRRDRETAAADRARAIAPRLSKLTIVVPAGAQVGGLRIERDGRELGPGAWSTAMPVDGGEHVVRATAPGKEPFSTTVVVGKEADAQTVEIPVLATPVVVVAPPGASPAPVPAPLLVPAPSPTPVQDTGRTPAEIRQVLGWTVGAAAVVQLGLAGYFGWRAFDKHGLSDDECLNGQCSQKGTEYENQARTAADVATVLTITGVVSAAVGTYLLVTSRNASAAKSAWVNPTLQIVARGSSLGIQGRF